MPRNSRHEHKTDGGRGSGPLSSIVSPMSPLKFRQIPPSTFTPYLPKVSQILRLKLISWFELPLNCLIIHFAPKFKKTTTTTKQTHTNKHTDAQPLGQKQLIQHAVLPVLKTWCNLQVKLCDPCLSAL